MNIKSGTFNSVPVYSSYGHQKHRPVPPRSAHQLLRSQVPCKDCFPWRIAPLILHSSSRCRLPHTAVQPPSAGHNAHNSGGAPRPLAEGDREPLVRQAPADRCQGRLRGNQLRARLWGWRDVAAVDGGYLEHDARDRRAPRRPGGACRCSARHVWVWGRGWHCALHAGTPLHSIRLRQTETRRGLPCSSGGVFSHRSSCALALVFAVPDVCVHVVIHGCTPGASFRN